MALGTWLFLALLFGYVFNYVTWKTGDGNFAGEGQRIGDIYAEMLPEAVPSVLVQGLPLFGGALMLVLGAITAGTGYGYRTWKTAYTQGPSRTSGTAGSLLALSALVVGGLAATLALFIAGSGLIALTEGGSLAPPWPGLSAPG